MKHARRLDALQRSATLAAGGIQTVRVIQNFHNSISRAMCAVIGRLVAALKSNVCAAGEMRFSVGATPMLKTRVTYCARMRMIDGF